MEVIKTAIDGVFILEPRIFNDARGYFFESFSGREFEEKVCRTTFVQDNESFSTYGVLRGLHFQKPPFTQSKLVRVIKGAVLDKKLPVILSSQFYSYVLSKSGRTFPDIYSHIQYRSLDHTHQLALCERRFLEMQAA